MKTTAARLHVHYRPSYVAVHFVVRVVVVLLLGRSQCFVAAVRFWPTDNVVVSLIGVMQRRCADFAKLR